MASGQQVIEFSLKIITSTYTPGPAGSVQVQVNCEGTAAGLGAVLGTATFVPAGMKNATYSWCGVSYLDNGDSMTDQAQGTIESIGPHKWRTQGIDHLSDGRIMRVEGEADLPARLWTGKLIAMD
jgi:hypothetical protein